MVLRGGARVAHHPVVRGRRRNVGEAVLLQRLQQPRRIELAGPGAGREAHGERRQGAVPKAMPPGGRGRADEAVAGPQAGAIEGRHHHRDDGAMAVLHRLGQLARRARGVLEDRQIVGAGVRLERRGERPELAQEIVSLDQELGLAVLDPELDAIGPEQGEQRHRDGAGLHRAEDGGVEGA
jgi:hypothetical protein